MWRLVKLRWSRLFSPGPESKQGREPTCLIPLSGRLTIEFTPDVRTYLMEQLRGCKMMTVDFAEVTSIDGSGVAILIEVLKAANGQGKTVRLSGLKDQPKYVFESTRLLPLFEETSQHD